jgi:hypothetical protein
VVRDPLGAYPSLTRETEKMIRYEKTVRPVIGRKRRKVKREMSDAGTAIRSFEIRLSESSGRITGIPEVMDRGAWIGLQCRYSQDPNGEGSSDLRSFGFVLLRKV